MPRKNTRRGKITRALIDQRPPQNTLCNKFARALHEACFNTWHTLVFATQELFPFLSRKQLLSAPHIIITVGRAVAPRYVPFTMKISTHVINCIYSLIFICSIFILIICYTYIYFLFLFFSVHVWNIVSWKRTTTEGKYCGLGVCSHLRSDLHCSFCNIEVP